MKPAQSLLNVRATRMNAEIVAAGRACGGLLVAQVTSEVVLRLVLLGAVMLSIDHNPRDILQNCKREYQNQIQHKSWYLVGGDSDACT